VQFYPTYQQAYNTSDRETWVFAGSSLVVNEYNGAYWWQLFSALFRFWRGSGRVLLVPVVANTAYAPNHLMEIVLQNDQMSTITGTYTGYGAAVENTLFKPAIQFEIPYNFGSTYQSTNNSANSQTTAIINIFGNLLNGMDLHVYVAAGDDFEFMSLRPPPLMQVKGWAPLGHRSGGHRKVDPLEGKWDKSVCKGPSTQRKMEVQRVARRQPDNVYRRPGQNV